MIIPNSEIGVLPSSNRLYSYLITDTLEERYYFIANCKVVDNKLVLINTSNLRKLTVNDSIQDLNSKNSNAKDVLSLYRLIMNEKGYIDTNIRVINANSSNNIKKMTFLVNDHGRKYRLRVSMSNTIITKIITIPQESFTKSSFLEIIQSKR